jgi:hypothetical protein
MRVRLVAVTVLLCALLLFSLWIYHRHQRVLESYKPVILEPLALPAPDVKFALAPSYVVIGTLGQSTSARTPYEPAAEITVREWATPVAPDVKHHLMFNEDIPAVYAYIPGRAWGHPFPAGDIGSTFIFIVKEAPPVITGPGYEIIGTECQLVGAYPFSEKTLAEIRKLITGAPTVSEPTTQPESAPAASAPAETRATEAAPSGRRHWAARVRPHSRPGPPQSARESSGQ